MPLMESTLENTLSEEQQIVLFDGVCNLCSGGVQFIIKRDKKDLFRFASLQSALGKKLLDERQIDPNTTDSMVLIQPGKAFYVRSDAVLNIGKQLPGAWSLIAVFQWIPSSIRDFVYDSMARYRYRWFGKKESCMIPTPELRSKFLDV